MTNERKPMPSPEERPDLYDDYDFADRDTSSMDYLMERFRKRQVATAAAQADQVKSVGDEPDAVEP